MRANRYNASSLIPLFFRSVRDTPRAWGEQRPNIQLPFGRNVFHPRSGRSRIAPTGGAPKNRRRGCATRRFGGGRLGVSFFAIGPGLFHVVRDAKKIGCGADSVYAVSPHRDILIAGDLHFVGMAAQKSLRASLVGWDVRSGPRSFSATAAGAA